ncbi:unnamed protein product [Aspergillus udagawae]|uniref:Unnamed protein product n=1 Tax=Aspergillus udagawae TaxID=91492 RepID=A0ABQ1A563_9EURO|nr:unnamed protein product [Aspergillus udagawae]GFF73814.1 unnamed protein product [Aspergillus udagawae]GFG01919.1 unnamed protein product [Aspergillus udagawae]GFG23696.1 unnamed protein product [Aspergillus udagawae]
MFGFNILVARSEVGLELPPHGLTFNGLLFPSAASLSASVSATVQACFANTETPRRFNRALMAHSYNRGATTAAINWHLASTRATRAGVADLVA